MSELTIREEALEQVDKNSRDAIRWKIVNKLEELARLKKKSLKLEAEIKLLDEGKELPKECNCKHGYATTGGLTFNNGTST